MSWREGEGGGWLEYLSRLISPDMERGEQSADINHHCQTKHNRPKTYSQGYKAANLNSKQFKWQPNKDYVQQIYWYQNSHLKKLEENSRKGICEMGLSGVGQLPDKSAGEPLLGWSTTMLLGWRLEYHNVIGMEIGVPQCYWDGDWSTTMLLGWRLEYHNVIGMEIGVPRCYWDGDWSTTMVHSGGGKNIGCIANRICCWKHKIFCGWLKTFLVGNMFWHLETLLNMETLQVA